MVEMRLDQRVAQRIDAADVLQEAYIEASQRLAEYVAHPEVPLFIWLRFIVGQRVAAAHRRHLNTEKRSVQKESRIPEFRPSAGTDSLVLKFASKLTSPSSAAFRSEMQERLRKAIDGLKVEDRNILLLRHFEELTNFEAAVELGITPAAASKRYLRALQRLREETGGLEL
jgi:RNA polymerase sigma-70 factor (ECF subfamily)